MPKIEYLDSKFKKIENCSKMSRYLWATDRKNLSAPGSLVGDPGASVSGPGGRQDPLESELPDLPEGPLTKTMNRLIKHTNITG